MTGRTDIPFSPALARSVCKFRDEPERCGWPECDCTQVGLRACHRLLASGWLNSAEAADLGEELGEARARADRAEALLREISHSASDGSAGWWAADAARKFLMTRPEPSSAYTALIWRSVGATPEPGYRALVRGPGCGPFVACWHANGEWRETFRGEPLTGVTEYAVLPFQSHGDRLP